MKRDSPKQKQIAARKQYIQDHKERKGKDEIAIDLNITIETVHTLCKEMGIKIKRHRQHLSADEEHEKQFEKIQFLETMHNHPERFIELMLIIFEGCPRKLAQVLTDMDEDDINELPEQRKRIEHPPAVYNQSPSPYGFADEFHNRKIK